MWRDEAVQPQARDRATKAAELAVALLDVLAPTDQDDTPDTWSDERKRTLAEIIVAATESPPLAAGPMLRLAPHVLAAARALGGRALRRATRKYARYGRWLLVRDTYSDIPALEDE